MPKFVDFFYTGFTNIALQLNGLEVFKLKELKKVTSEFWEGESGRFPHKFLPMVFSR